MFRVLSIIWGSLTHLKCVYFCKAGVWLWYKGDEVLWCWTWHQPHKYLSNGQPYCWVSLISEGGFKSLKDMDEFWEEFDRYHNGI